MCWFHCKNAIDKKLSLIRDLASRAVVITQIVIMQLSQTPEIFQAAAKLFLEQWKSNTDVKLSDDVIRQRQEVVEQERLRKENERKQKAAKKVQDKLESVAKRKKKNI